MKLRPLILATSVFALLPTLNAAPPDKLELKKGDHVSILGNELADRMQHTGWLETLIEKKFAADLKLTDLVGEKGAASVGH